MRKLVSLILIAVLATSIAGCAAGPSTGGDYDPWQGFNRPMHDFNMGVDAWVMEPVAKGWTFVTNDWVRVHVNQFMVNLRWPVTFVANIAQGEFWDACTETGRFLINTTVGLVGFFDPATDWGIDAKTEDVGQSFGVWGFDQGPYLVIPLLGPSGGRDAIGTIFDLALSPQSYYFPLRFIDLTNWRAMHLAQIENAKSSALDFYAFVRSAYLQRREALVNDTADPEAYLFDASDDLYDESLFDEDSP